MIYFISANELVIHNDTCEKSIHHSEDSVERDELQMTRVYRNVGVHKHFEHDT